MKSLIIPVLTLVILLMWCNKPQNENISELSESSQSVSMNQRVKKALEFCLREDYNTNHCILVDMSLHSGKKRLHLWDFNNKEIINSYLVSHGCCENQWSRDETRNSPTFKNTKDSHCSSLGKYRIGDRGWSSFGVNINYRLHGIEPSNSNAFDRNIVFHSWDMVDDEEPYPAGTPEGWGCPAISNKAFLEIDPYLKDTSKPTLFWIYQN